VEITRKLLTELGCRVIPIHCTPDGLFPHDPEPTFRNLQDLCGLASEQELDVAFAQDPDADRLAVVDETGRFIGEEYTLALVADYVLSNNPGRVVINMSTSRATEDVAARHNCGCERVPVGEVNVAVRMREVGAVIGGEGNGGVIDPRVHLGRDSLTGIALILEDLASSGKKLSERVAALPQYVIRKTKVELDRARTNEALRALASEAASSGARVNDIDGLRLDWDDHWVHVRPSNTEPVVRVIAEAADKTRVKELVGSFVERIQRIGKA
jgi:phosphomannomutase